MFCKIISFAEKGIKLTMIDDDNNNIRRENEMRKIAEIAIIK